MLQLKTFENILRYINRVQLLINELLIKKSSVYKSSLLWADPPFIFFIPLLQRPSSY